MRAVLEVRVGASKAGARLAGLTAAQADIAKQLIASLKPNVLTLEEDSLVLNNRGLKSPIAQFGADTIRFIGATNIELGNSTIEKIESGDKKVIVTINDSSVTPGQLFHLNQGFTYVQIVNIAPLNPYLLDGKLNKADIVDYIRKNEAAVAVAMIQSRPDSGAHSLPIAMPNGTYALEIDYSDTTQYTLRFDGKLILTASPQQLPQYLAFLNKTDQDTEEVTVQGLVTLMQASIMNAKMELPDISLEIKRPMIIQDSLAALDAKTIGDDQTFYMQAKLKIAAAVAYHSSLSAENQQNLYVYWQLEGLSGDRADKIKILLQKIALRKEKYFRTDKIGIAHFMTVELRNAEQVAGAETNTRHKIVPIATPQVDVLPVYQHAYLTAHHVGAAYGAVQESGKSVRFSQSFINYFRSHLGSSVKDKDQINEATLPLVFEGKGPSDWVFELPTIGARLSVIIKTAQVMAAAVGGSA